MSVATFCNVPKEKHTEYVCCHLVFKHVPFYDAASVWANKVCNLSNMSEEKEGQFVFMY